MATNSDCLKAYRPRRAWWARPKGAAGIHGLGHCIRVLLWADHIAKLLSADGVAVDLTVVRWAAACHDCRRHDEGLDLGHGLRAAAWFGKEAERLDSTLTPEQVKAVQHAVTWHVPPDTECPCWTPELKCLKDADGLDRVRLGDFDPDYLRLPYLHGREADARALLHATPPADADPWVPLLATARTLRILRC
jgi:uncharacterized protein